MRLIFNCTEFCKGSIVLKNSVFEPAMIISAFQDQQKSSDTEES
jgi:hypothetical protein